MFPGLGFFKAYSVSHRGRMVCMVFFGLGFSKARSISHRDRFLSEGNSLRS